MYTMSELEAVWRNDGHEMFVTLRNSECNLEIAACPHRDKPDTDCFSAEADGCIVRWFLDTYGLECNVGIAPAASRMTIAWTRMGGETLNDCQVWVMPAEDEAFRGFLEQIENGDDK